MQDETQTNQTPEEVENEMPQQADATDSAVVAEPEPHVDEDSISEAPEETNEDTKTALSILQVEDMINRQMEDIEKLRDDVKLLKSSYEDAFKNDAKYREIDEKVKEATKVKKQYVQAMKKDPAIAAAEQEFISKRDDLKDLQTGLSEYLREYHRISGLTQFETKDGQMLHLVQVYKLVRK